METMGSLRQHLHAKPKAFSYGTRRAIPVFINTRVQLQARVPSSVHLHVRRKPLAPCVFKCSAAFKHLDKDEEGGPKFKGLGNTDVGASLLKKFFPLVPVLGDVLGPVDKIDQVVSSYDEKLNKLKMIADTLEVKLGADVGELAYLANLEMMDQLINHMITNTLKVKPGEDGGEHAYLAKLELVEELIYQGKFEIAQKYCANHVLRDAPPNDPRPRFYLVVAQVVLMLDMAEKTSKYWKEVVDNYWMLDFPVTEPDEDAGPMLSPVENGGEDRLILFVEVMKIFKQAVSGESGNDGRLPPPFHKY
ncbi:uncharacterized protein [Aristolochia californica]|uniref:uncharacterized protein n=1 Tax=Aristolochia californica TaxID=171875 RepID=UPI0035DA893C